VVEVKRVESLWVPDSLNKVWMITFEMRGIASSGGLGSAVYYLSTGLTKRGMSVTVIMPSHGRHLDGAYRSRLKLRELPLSTSGKRRGVDNQVYPYRLGFERGELDGVEVVLVKGLDEPTGRVMDSWGVYDWAMEKSALLTRGVEALVGTLTLDGVPSLIHAHDWHSVLPGVKAKLALEERRVVVPLVYTVHLLNRVGAPWHYASSDWTGLEDCSHYIWMVSKHVLRKPSEIWDLSEGRIEKFGVYEADLVTSVSKNYLVSEVIPYVGGMAENKSCVIYNGTDWDLGQVLELAKRVTGSEDRKEVRRKLLASLNTMRLVPENYNVGNMLWNHRKSLGIRDDWTYEPLGDGQLILFTGRLVYQKGVDVLVRSFRGVVDREPETRLLMLGIPTDDYALLQDLIDRVSEVRDNVRIIASSSMDPNMYKLLHYSASVMAMPSRWEPFGIGAIEAMSVGTPVVASATGGLSEIVEDLRYSQEGTGFLVEPGNIDSLRSSLLDSVILSKASEGRGGVEGTSFRAVPETWAKARENAVRRVDRMFRWSSVTQQALECYGKALLMAKYRASAYM